MSGAVFAAAVVIWLVAAYAFLRVSLAWFGVMKLAPVGVKFRAALDLGLWNFSAVERRVGAGAAAHIASYRRGFILFVGAFAVFMALVLVNIAIGNAA